MDVLDFDRGFVHKDADSQSQAAEAYEVDRLTRQPQPHYRPQQRERNVQDNDQGRPPVSQEHDDHQPCQHCTEQPFRHDAPHSPRITLA